jgi:hypothetical protein
MKKYIFLILIFCSCAKAPTEKYQSSRDNIINVHDKIEEIIIENPLISSATRLYIIDRYLIICDTKSLDNQIYLFDKTTLKYIVGFGQRGPGPCEITLLGAVGIDQERRSIYISDNAKYKIYTYELDSVINNSLYCPKVKMNMDSKNIPDRYIIVNRKVLQTNTLCFHFFVGGTI